MKRASALLKNGRILLQGYSRSTSGVWIAHGPVYLADVGQSDRIKANVLEALKHSTEGVPHPDQSGWKAIQKPMLEAVGAKTWAGLAKGAKSVGITCVGEQVTFVPSSGYEKNGGVPLSDNARTSLLTAEDIAERLIEAFDACG